MKNRTDHHTAETPEQLIHDIQRLMAEVEALVGQPSTDAETGSKLSHLQEKLSGATARVQDFYQSTRKRVVAGAHQADETIRSHPYQSLAVALGVGVLLGALIRRSRD